MSAAAPSASTCRSTSQLPNDFFTQAVIVAKDVAARERLHRSSKRCWPTKFPRPGRARLPARARPAGRLAGAVPRQRARRRPGARHRPQASPRSSRRTPRHTQVNFDWIEPRAQLRMRVDQDEARLLGLSSQALAAVLNTVISGTTVTQVRDDIYLVDVVARATDEQRVSLDTLRTLQVPLPNGRTVAAQPVRDASNTSRNTRWSGGATACRP